MHGVRGYRLVRQKMVKGGIAFYIEVNRNKLCCPDCNSIADAEWSQIPEMLAFAKTLRNHWEKILNYHCCEITSGPLEGLNNKIKTLKRQSYGFRDQEYFKLKILAIHRSRYPLLG